MNIDFCVMLLRYALIGAGTYIVNHGFASADAWSAFVTQSVGYATIAIPVIWGMWVKWNTKTVSAATASRADVPTVSTTTGATIRSPMLVGIAALAICGAIMLGGCNATLAAGVADACDVEQSTIAKLQASSNLAKVSLGTALARACKDPTTTLATLLDLAARGRAMLKGA